MSLSLREGLSCANIDGRIYMLDLATGRYSRLSDETSEAFTAVVARSPLDARLRAALSTLLDSGLLIAADRAEQPNLLCAAKAPTGSFFDDPALQGSRLAVAQALLLLLIFTLRLRLQGVGTVVRAIEQRKAHARFAKGPWIEARIAVIIAAFARVDLIIGRTSRCLPRSTALMSMLLSAGCRAEMLFGVADRPFNAHCWVQRGPELLSDRLEQVHEFTPILQI